MWGRRLASLTLARSSLTPLRLDGFAAAPTPHLPMPLGVRVQLDAEARTLALLDPAVHE